VEIVPPLATPNGIGIGHVIYRWVRQTWSASKYFRFHHFDKLPSVCEILPSGISRLAPYHWNERSSENIHFEFSMEI